MINGVSAEHVERALVVERCTQGAVAVKGYIVLGVLVHKQFNGCRWIGVNYEVYVDIGVIGSRTGSSCLTGRAGVCRVGFAWLLPGDELLIADGIRACGVIHEYRAGLGGNVTVNDYIVAVTAYRHVARGIYRTIEGRFAKVVKVVCQQVVGPHKQVVAQIGKVLVVNTT